jgi:hypothetical protein
MPGHHLDGPVTTDAHRKPIDPVEAWTPYVAEAIGTARATSNDMLSWLVDRHKQLIQQIYERAVTLVREHRNGEVSRASEGRFNAALTQWRAALNRARTDADSAADHANLRIDCYWGWLVRTHRRRVPQAYECAHLRPAHAVLDPVWGKPDTFLLLQFGSEDDETTAKAARMLQLALEIISTQKRSAQ